jgi:putative DNA primase/helicase
VNKVRSSGRRCAPYRVAAAFLPDHITTMNPAYSMMIEGHEQVLLAAMMNGRDLPIQERDFSSPPNRLIFNTLCSLKIRSSRALHDTLQRRGRLKEVGGITRLTEILLLPTDKANVEFALDQVLEASRERRSQEIGKKLQKGEITADQAAIELGSSAPLLSSPVRRVAVVTDPTALLKKLSKQFGPPAFGKRLEKINERFFAELLKLENHLTHEANEEKFYLYAPKNGLWERTSVHTLKSKLSDRIRLAAAQWKIPLALDTEHNRRNVIALLRGVVNERDYFSNRPHAIHAVNCMLVFENRSIVPKPFAPEFLSRNQLTVSYEPGATCPQFEGELLLPALASDDFSTTRKMFGLLVLGRNRPQRIFILIGAGNTGKTTTGLVAEGLIGQENCAELRTAQLDGRFELARLVGKILVFGPDVSANFLMSKGAHRLKSLVGGDPLIAERKNSNEAFPFKGDLNALITANEDLLIRLHGDFDRSAWERRLCPLRFVREPIKTRIPFFHRELLATEGSGILNFSLNGLLEYYQDEAARGDLVLSAEQASRIENLLTQSDGFRSFISRELVASDGEDISVDELITSYATYARGKKWRIPKQQTLQEQAQELMIEIWGIARSHSVERDGKNVRGYRGVRFRGENENDPNI